MVERKYWYVVRFNVREYDEYDVGEVLRVEYCVIKGLNFSDVAHQLMPFKKPFEEKTFDGITRILKRSIKIYGTEFERHSDALDYVILLKHQNKKQGSEDN